MNIRMVRFAILTLITLLLSSCTQFARVNITGYLDKSNPSQISPSSNICVIDDDQANNLLLEKEIKHKIVKLLEKKGYQISSPDKADYLLFFAYGMGAPREISVAVPKVGYGLSSIGHYKLHSFGVGTGTAHRTMHDRWLLINVVDANKYRQNGKLEAVWVGDTKSAGTSSDLRLVINYLLASTFDYFGKDTGKQITVDITKDDPRAASL